MDSAVWYTAPSIQHSGPVIEIENKLQRWRKQQMKKRARPPNIFDPLLLVNLPIPFYWCRCA